ncbi:MAG: glycerophosphodiester phosphodiesterase [Planctomycetia bacterium]|nr:glycerophosphodiester phosphodiesterase [Planctomycetia bacterium]
MLEIIAHRGASHDAPENTLNSVRLAWEQAADAVEIDCHLTADGQIVVIHDADTRRVTGEKLVVAESSLADLQRLDYGRWKGPQFAGEPLPLLAEVIATMPAGKRLFIEIKCGPEVLPALAKELDVSDRPAADFVVIGFHHHVVHGIKQLRPQVPAYLLARTTGSDVRRVSSVRRAGNVIDDLVDQAKAVGADALDVEYSELVDSAFVDRASQDDLPCYVWTVDVARVARRLRKAGVRGITTNRPGWLRQQLSRREEAGR